MSADIERTCNTHEFKKSLKGEDAAILKALEEAGWSPVLQDFRYLWQNNELNEEHPCVDDEECLRTMRLLHAQLNGRGLKRAPEASITEDDDPATVGRQHKKEKVFTMPVIVAPDEPSTATSLFPDGEVEKNFLIQQIHPSKITTHPQTLMRAGGLDEDHANELREVLRAGREFKDPVVLFFDGKDYHLGAGNHRRAAALAEGKLLNADVRTGTLRDAILYAMRSNSEHGLKRSNDDKRLAVVTLLSDPEWFGLSDGQLGEMSDVTQQFISGVRRHLAKLFPLMEADPDGEESDEAYAAHADIPIGLVRVVRGLPMEERVILSQNILTDDGLRLGVDGVKRSKPSKAEPVEPVAPLFKEPDKTTDDEQQRAQFEQLQAEHDQRINELRANVLSLNSLDEINELRERVRAQTRSLEKLGVTIDDPTDWKAEEVRVTIDAMVMRERELKEALRASGEAVEPAQQATHTELSEQITPETETVDRLTALWNQTTILFSVEFKPSKSVNYRQAELTLHAGEGEPIIIMLQAHQLQDSDGNIVIPRAFVRQLVEELPERVKAAA